MPRTTKPSRAGLDEVVELFTVSLKMASAAETHMRAEEGMNTAELRAFTKEGLEVFRSWLDRAENNVPKRRTSEPPPTEILLDDRLFPSCRAWRSAAATALRAEIRPGHGGLSGFRSGER